MVVKDLKKALELYKPTGRYSPTEVALYNGGFTVDDITCRNECRVSELYIYGLKDGEKIYVEYSHLIDALKQVSVDDIITINYKDETKKVTIATESELLSIDSVGEPRLSFFTPDMEIRENPISGNLTQEDLKNIVIASKFVNLKVVAMSTHYVNLRRDGKIQATDGHMLRTVDGLERLNSSHDLRINKYAAAYLDRLSKLTLIGLVSFALVETRREGMEWENASHVLKITSPMGTFYTDTFNGIYPKFEAVTPSDSNLVMNPVVSVKTLRDALKVLCKNKEVVGVKIHLTENHKMRIEGYNEEKGIVPTSVPFIDYTGEPIPKGGHIVIANHEILYSIISKVKTKEVTFRFTYDKHRQFLLKELGKENITWLQMPLYQS